MDRQRKTPAWACRLALLVALTAAATAGAGERFTDNGDGTVTDHRLGLLWSASDNQGDIDWHQAFKWVRFTLPYTVGRPAGPWRLPTLAELESLAADSAADRRDTICGLQVKLAGPIRLSCGWVWSSEVDPRAPTARAFNFQNATSFSARKAHRRGYRALGVLELP